MMGVGRTAIEHHARALAADGRLHTFRYGRRIGHFAGTPSADDAKLMMLLRRGIVATLLRALVDEPRSTPSQLAARLGVTEPTIRWHMARLRTEGLVAFDGSPPALAIRVTARAAAALADVDGLLQER